MEKKGAPVLDSKNSSTVIRGQRTVNGVTWLGYSLGIATVMLSTVLTIYSHVNNDVGKQRTSTIPYMHCTYFA